MISLERAKEFQQRGSRLLILKPPPKEFRLICGVDAAFDNKKIYAVACLFGLDKSSSYIIEEAQAIQDIRYPYIPGFFAWREGPALIEAVKKLKRKPDIILVDGHGIAHPRGFGIASHIGFVLQIPTIGCAKNSLVGDYVEPDIERGSWRNVVFNGKIVGAVLRTKSRVKPVFVSPGNLIDIDTAIKIILSVSIYRIPEPLRSANIRAKTLSSKK